MSPGEVTPGIQAGEYEARRQRLAAALPSGSLALFPATPQAYMSHDVPYFPHHQDTDLLYLCGLQEHTSLLACVKPASSSTARWHLFVRPSDPREELWDGARAGVDGAQAFFLPEGATHAINDAPKVLASELGGGELSSLFYDSSTNKDLDGRLRPTLISPAGTKLGGAQPVRQLVHSLRLHKSAAEIALMRRAGTVGAQAMRATMQSSTHAAARGMAESALSATFEFECRAVGGAERLAYPCVVAGGANAVTLHYMHNNALLRPGEMLLMDAGASVHGYCSDVTRTWPLGGVFSPAQRALYDAVLDVNERVIEAASSQRVSTSLNSLHRLSLTWTFEHLVDLGIVRRDDPRAAARVQRYYPHAIGHWLGLDVHDTPSIDSGVQFDAGMVITVEPGMYIPADDHEAPEHFRGLGVRIEDDVLLPATRGAPAEVLTAAAPKRADEIEAMLAAA